MSTRLEQQIAFILEIDRLKGILRQTVVTSGERRENGAEHSWHLAMMAILLAEHADEPNLDLAKVIKQLLVHDLVEIYAGDTFIYDAQACAGQAEREQAAADRIFGMLPPEQADELRTLWEEFESRATPESRFAGALDRLQPVLLNIHSQGHAWRLHGVTLDQVIDRNGRIADASQALWSFARERIEQASRDGFLPVSPKAGKRD
jgi:putative hydrolases of HD superfamily